MTTKAKTLNKLEDLTPDSANANKGTERGAWQLEESLNRYGAGRSILTDKHGVVIAGNKTHQKGVEMGLGARIVHTSGDDLVVVVRDDLDLESDPKARELALVDNRVGEVSLEWDVETLAEQMPELDLDAFWTAEDLAALTGDDVPAGDQSGQLEGCYQVLVSCIDERAQKGLLERLADEGYECRALVQ